MRIAVVTPRPLVAGRSSPQERLLALVRALREAGADVATGWLVGDGTAAGPASGDRIADPADPPRADALMVSDAWTPDEAAPALAVARAARQRGVPVVYDSVDFLTGVFLGIADGAVLRALAAAEGELRGLAAAVLYVTRVEAAKAEALHGPAAGEVLVVPSCHPPLPDPPGHGERRHVCFIGSGSPHNVAAVRAFAERVLPHLLKSDPTAEFHVLGADHADARISGTAELLSRIRLIGAVPDAVPALSAYRAFACPMVSGSGLKGKVLDAMAAGTPVVATVPSVEGMHCVQGDSVVLAELGVGFARALQALDRDPVLWSRISRGGLELVGERYGPAAMEANARRLLAVLAGRAGG